DRGAPSGVFVDNAQGLIGRVIPPSSPDEQRAEILAAIAEANRWGLTGIHDAGVSSGTIDLYEELARAGRYNLRNYVLVAGDRANRVVLVAYEQALRAVPTADHRFRVEHAQILHRQDIARFAQLGVIPSMQTSHQASDAPMAMTRLGWTRVQGGYAWRSLLNT